MTLLRRLTFTTLAATYVLVAVGGLVRATESGLGCPDWPRCHGGLVPPDDFHARIEFSHRFIASIVIALSVALAVVAWRRARERRDLLVPAVSTVPLVLIQAILGAVVVALELHAESVVAHLLLAMSFAAVLVVLLANQERPPLAPGESPDRWFVRAAAVVALGSLAVMLLGSYVSGREAGLAFTDWPLFDGRVVPIGRGDLGWLHGTHRLLAGVVGVAVGWLAWSARRRAATPGVRRLVVGAGFLYLAQIALGAGNVLTELSEATRTAHLAVGAAIWILLAGATALARRTPAPDPGAHPAPAPMPAPTAAGEPAAPDGEPEPIPATMSRSGRARAYFLLTKPRVIELLLVTTLPAMVLAERGVPSVGLMAAVLVGGALAAGGANTINCYIDRDRDRDMRRTQRRPLPAGTVEPVAALRFGIVLEVLAFAWLWASANLLAATLAISATLFYVFVYSLWLKPRTAQNIVIGGAAGAVPVLVGWAAVTQDLASPAWVLFAIIFVWTPPHFWALAMRYRDDYQAAGVPMLPVVAGVHETTRQIFLYAVVVVAVTLFLQPVADLGLLYVVVALGLGGMFVWRALQLRRDASPGRAMALFTFSNVYLALLFAAVAVDVIFVSGG